MNDSKPKLTPIVAGVAIFGIIASGVGLALFNNSDENEANNTETQNNQSSLNNSTLQEPQNTITPTSIAMMQEYRNGRFTANGNYSSPGGAESVRVTIELENGIVKNVEFEGQTSNSTSRRFHGFFESGLSAQVVGKNIEEIRLGRVSGSSLTSIGFNAALENIKNESRV
jgi:hypothetical protein